MGEIITRVNYCIVARWQDLMYLIRLFDRWIRLHPVRLLLSLIFEWWTWYSETNWRIIASLSLQTVIYCAPKEERSNAIVVQGWAEVQPGTRWIRLSMFPSGREPTAKHWDNILINCHGSEMKGEMQTKHGWNSPEPGNLRQPPQHVLMCICRMCGDKYITTLF